MKRCLVVFLTLTMLAQSFVQVGVVMYYHLNKTYIANKLCENRKNADSHCNGKCYLSKQLKKAEEGEKKQATYLVKEKQEYCSDNNTFVVGEQFTPSVPATYNLYKSSTPAKGFYQTPVKPPAA